MKTVISIKRESVTDAIQELETFCNLTIKVKGGSVLKFQRITCESGKETDIVKVREIEKKYS